MNDLTRRQVLRAGAAGAVSAVGTLGTVCTATPLRAEPAPPPGASLTMLNAMAGRDIEVAARRHAELGLRWLDLKDQLFGQTINDLSLPDARRVAAIARDHGLGIASFSTALCGTDLAAGQAAFDSRHGATLDHVLSLVDVLQPRSIRLVSAQLTPYPGEAQVMATVEQRHAWVFDSYGRLVDRIHAAGCLCLIENEVDRVILTRPEGVLRFFERLQRPAARYTWDVQNLWEMGTPPSLAVYQQLKPLIGCIHLKGGRSEAGGSALVHASALEDATWPVLDIVRAAVADGVAPILCLNPSHGRKPPGFDVWQVALRDITYLRAHVDANL